MASSQTTIREKNNPSRAAEKTSSGQSAIAQFELILGDPEKRLLVEELGYVMPAELVLEWLVKPNKGFQGAKPIDLILRGDYEPIRQMIYEVDSGQPT